MDKATYVAAARPALVSIPGASLHFETPNGTRPVPIGRFSVSPLITIGQIELYGQYYATLPFGAIRFLENGRVKDVVRGASADVVTQRLNLQSKDPVPYYSPITLLVPPSLESPGWPRLTPEERLLPVTGINWFQAAAFAASIQCELLPLSGWFSRRGTRLTGKMY